MEKAKVYYTKEITPENLIKIYEALGVELKGKIGVKVSTGEGGARGYLKADLIGPFVKKLNGTIIEDVKKIDEYKHCLIMCNQIEIPINEIIEVLI